MPSVFLKTVTRVTHYTLIFIKITHISAPALLEGQRIGAPKRLHADLRRWAAHTRVNVVL